MNVASLELCKELYELSGWDETEFKYWNGAVSNDIDGSTWDWGKNNYKQNCSPAYDLGYLLRKLNDDRHLIEVYNVHGMNWRAKWEMSFSQNAQTPEDAACRLAIELSKQGVLTKEKQR